MSTSVPIRLLATSAKSAVNVHITATRRDKSSPLIQGKLYCLAELNLAQEFFGYGKTLVSHCVPEVEILLEMSLHARSVADDAETEERNIP